MKICTVVGARPQFVKAATLSRAIAKRNVASAGGGAETIVELIVHTGQHYDARMSEVFFDELGIPAPAYNLGIGSGSHGAQTGEMLAAVEKVIEHEQPDWVLVYGDTNSTLAAALTAAKMHVPVAHVEAGLRSFNRRMPEEINRLVSDHLSRLRFCPTSAAVENLAREGITDGVENVGDVMYDGMLHYRGRASSSVLSRLGLAPRQYVLATVHRAENTDDPDRLEALMRALAAAGERIGAVVLPLHPRTRKMLDSHGIEPAPTVHVIEPAPYLELIALLANARAVMTDSGGVQKEAFFLEVPCITLRNETEWVETVACGANRLVGADPEAAEAAIDDLIAGRWHADFTSAPYGDGKAAEAIVASLIACRS